MKLIGLFLALGLFGAMGMMLVATSTDASAQSAFTTKARLANASTAPLNEPPANFVEHRTRFASQPQASELPRKNPQKRSRNRCARITTTCWNSA